MSVDVDANETARYERAVAALAAALQAASILQEMEQGDRAIVLTLQIGERTIEALEWTEASIIRATACHGLVDEYPMDSHQARILNSAFAMEWVLAAPPKNGARP